MSLHHYFFPIQDYSSIFWGLSGVVTGDQWAQQWPVNREHDMYRGADTAAAGDKWKFDFKCVDPPLS